MRTQTINKIIADNGYQSYLEIGLGDGSNFKSIKADFKRGVDPFSNSLDYGLTNEFSVSKETSDNFFIENENKFDLIFIDGDHTSQQVEKDIINSYKALNKGGMILLHDVNPPSEEAQIVPRKQDQWTGDVWRAVVGFKDKYPKIRTEYFNDTYGLLAIHKSGRFVVKEGFTQYDMTYEEFDENKPEYLGMY